MVDQQWEGSTGPFRNISFEKLVKCKCQCTVRYACLELRISVWFRDMYLEGIISYVTA